MEFSEQLIIGNAPALCAVTAQNYHEHKPEWELTANHLSPGCSDEGVHTDNVSVKK